jgi:DNA-binding NarL/FixJ family response regulator
MPRKRLKTAADRSIYRPPSTPPLAVPDQLQPFLAGMEIQRIVTKYGVANVQLVLGVIAELARREMVEQRSRETLDLWKSNVRPLASVTMPELASLTTSEKRRSAPRYRRHREAAVDTTIRQQTRVREIEAGLAIILEKEPDGWYRRELVDIANSVKAGETVAEIADGLSISVSTIERRLAELREAACAK